MSTFTAKTLSLISARTCILCIVQIVAGSLLVSLPTDAAWADEIYFKSGYAQTAVVLRETEDEVKFKTDMGISTIKREKIDFVEKATPEENRVLLKKWRAKETARREIQEARREAKLKFEKEQLAKGLIKFEDNWMTPEEKRQILSLRKRALEHRQQFEREQREKGLVQFQHIWVTSKQADELRMMEKDIYALYEDILSLKERITGLRAAMLNVASLDEAEEFGERIDEIKETIAKRNDQLGLLLDRADEIEANSVRYVVPDEFSNAFVPEAETE